MKTFDIVNCDILLKTVAKHKIKVKILYGCRNFSVSENIVVANGLKTDIQDVLLGVQQETVLVALLFFIMISDIDENVKNCMIRLFAGDQRTVHKLNQKTT